MKSSQAAGTGEADASTRSRVQASILECGPSTAAELAVRLGLTAAAVRRHLDTLTDAGLVEARDQRVYGARGRGRPAKVFALTDTGRGGFYANYDGLAISALQFLATHAGPEAVTAFASSRAAEAEARYREVLSGAGDDATPAEILASALTDDGYVASTRPSPYGEQLCQHHCPVAHVAAEFPQLCEAESAAFARLLGTHVQRLATIAHGDGVCTTHVPAPQTSTGRPGRPSADPPSSSAPSTSAPSTSAPSTPPTTQQQLDQPQPKKAGR